MEMKHEQFDTAANIKTKGKKCLLILCFIWSFLIICCLGFHTCLYLNIFQSFFLFQRGQLMMTLYNHFCLLENMLRQSILLVLCLTYLTQASVNVFGPDATTCNGNNQIQVSGQATVSAPPDEAVIRVRFEVRAPTPSEGIDQLATKVQALVAALTQQNLSSDSYETQSFNIYDDYQNGEVVGKVVSQSLTIRLEGIQKSGTKIASLVDALGQINGLILDLVDLDIEDKTLLQKQAREQAYQNAREKAKDYAGLAGLRVGRALLIEDEAVVEAPVFESSARLVKNSALAADFSTSTPLGELDVEYRLVVTFELL